MVVNLWLRELMRVERIGLFSNQMFLYHYVFFFLFSFSNLKSGFCWHKVLNCFLFSNPFFHILMQPNQNNYILISFIPFALTKLKVNLVLDCKYEEGRHCEVNQHKSIWTPRCLLLFSTKTLSWSLKSFSILDWKNGVKNLKFGALCQKKNLVSDGKEKRETKDDAGFAQKKRGI